jgi:lysophospholipase L1-like esterase
LLAVFALIVSMFVVLGSQPATATGDWPVSLDDIRSPVNLHTYPDGEVTVSCNGFNVTGYGPNQLETFAADGSDVLQLANSGNDKWSACLPGNNNVAGQDGITFVVKAVTVTQSYSARYLVAYQDGVELWSYPFATASCSNKNMYPEDVVVGSDGNPYFLLYYSCNGYKHDLVSVDVSDGSERFRQTVSTASYSDVDKLLAHDDGIVYYQYDDTFRYFDLDGVEDTQNSYTVPTSANESVRHFAMQPDGTLFVSLIVGSSYAPSPCTHEVVVSVVKRTIGGSVSTYDTSSHCVYAPNNWDVMPTPDGGAVILGSTEGDYKLVFLQTGGTSTNEESLPADEGHTSVVYQRPWVDLSGNLVVVRQFNMQDDGDNDTHTEVLLLDEDGQQKAHFTTESWKTSSQDSFKSSYSTNGLSRGYVYLQLCQSGSCTYYADPPEIHKIPFVEVDIDYPRGVILGEQADPVESLDYVAVGDSYISGEGVPDFEDGTDTAGPPENRCHRSEMAYWRQLDQEPSVNLQLVSNPACSGATTINIADSSPWTATGQWNEDPQLDAIPTDADVILLSIGGNDIDFANGMIACSMTSDAQVCENTLSVISGNVHSSWFEQRIDDIYTAIANKASGADVFVIGYSQFMGLPNETKCDWPLHGMTSTEEGLVDDIGTTLNEVIEDEATEAGFTFIPVAEAFGEHTVCSSEPFVNGVDLINNEYSYHPNSDGVSKILELVLEELL